jgi:integrase
MTAYEKIDSKGNKRYYYRFMIRGKEYNRAVPEATSLKDAEKAEAIIKADLLQGKYNLVDGKEDMLFEKLVEKYKEYAKNNKKTWESELCKVNKLAEYFKGMRLNDITPAVIEGFKTERKTCISKRGTEVSGATVNRDLAILSKMFSIAVLNGWVYVNPALNCRVPKFQENTEIIRYLNDTQEKRLINACSGKYAYLKPIILTALQTGMRFGEIAHLKWKENVDLRNGYITLTKEMTKSKKKRVIPMSSILLKVFKELNKNNDYIFANPNTGKPYNDLRDSWITVKKLAEIPDEFRFHDLRHSMACKLMDKNVNVGVIKDLLGHCSLSVTQKYTHAKDCTKKIAVELLAEGY